MLLLCQLEHLVDYSVLQPSIKTTYVSLRLFIHCQSLLYQK